MTPLDTAHAAMEASGDDTARLRFFDRLTDAELFLMLTEEPTGDTLSPDLIDTAEGRFALAFDTEQRLAEFAGKITPYAALSGRALAAMLAGQGVGLALNPDVAPSAILLPADALVWLVETLAKQPESIAARPTALSTPKGLPELLLTALDAKLAAATGLAQAAWLVAVTYDTGAKGHMLAFVDPRPGAESALTRAMAEALTFSGIEAGWLDVAFVTAQDPIAERLARVGLRFDLPQSEHGAAQDGTPGQNPGMNPDRPPRLR